MSNLDYFNDTHRMVRDTTRRFVDQHVLPFVDEWEESGSFPRELYRQAADAGLLGIGFPEEYGGAGEDVFMMVAYTEEMMRSTSGGWWRAWGPWASVCRPWRSGAVMISSRASSRKCSRGRRFPPWQSPNQGAALMLPT